MAIPIPAVKSWRQSFLVIVLGPLLLLMAGLLLATWPAAATGPARASGPAAAPGAWTEILTTTVSGPIVTSTTWTRAGSPYIVVGDVTVQNAAVLTIEPGVEVRFVPSTTLMIGNGGTAGQLAAEGTAALPITFTAHAADPARGFWTGIVINLPVTTTLPSSLGYCVVEYAGTGFVSGVTDGHVVHDCVFRHNADGGDPLSGGAMRIDDDVMTIVANEMYDNEQGIRLAKSFSDIISGNHIYDNDGSGVIFAYEQAPGGGTGTIVGNRIHDNAGDGIRLEQSANNRVENNQIYRNTGTGLRLDVEEPNQVDWNNRVWNNTIRGNGGDGIRADGQGALQVTGNVVRANGGNGLTYAADNVAPAALDSNVLCGNSGFQLESLWDAILPAEGNWFGTNTPMLGQEVSGTVDFDPWITMDVAVEPATLPADGSSTAVLTLTMSSGAYYVPDGYTVTVSASAGEVLPPVLTLIGGQAGATYVAGIECGPVLIEATDGCATLAFTEVLTLTSYLDLAVSKTDGGLVVGPDQEYGIEYTISVTNLAPVSATGVLVTDTLPQPASYTGTAWTCLLGECHRTLGTLAPSSTVQVSLPLALNLQGLDCPFVLTNTVRVAGAGSCGATAQPGSVYTRTTVIPCLPDLYVVLNDNVGPLPLDRAWAFQPDVQPGPTAPRLCVSPGELITYSVAYGNKGLAAATQVVLTETVPDYTSFADWVPQPWTCAGAVCTHTVGSLAPPNGGLLPFIVQVDAAPPDLVIEDGAHIGSAEADLYPPDNDSYDDTPVCNRCLELTKDDNTDCAFPGDQIRYTIRFTNTCAQPIDGLVLTETLPAYTGFVPATGWASLGGGQYGYDYGSLGANMTGTVEFVVMVNDPLPDPVEETVNVVCAGHAGSGQADQCYELVTALPREADLRVVKADHVGPPPPLAQRRQIDRFRQVLYGRADPWPAVAPSWEPVHPGDVYSYTIMYLNMGREPVGAVILTETLPAHTAYVGYGWERLNSTTYISRVGDLDVHQGGEVNYWVQADPGACTSHGFLYNWVRIGGAADECNLDNNWSEVDTPIDAPICAYNIYLPLVFKHFSAAASPTPTATATPTPTPTPIPSRAYVSDVAVNEVTNRVYVASPQLNSVFAVNPADGAPDPIVATIPVGDDPWGLAVITTTNKIYAANFKSNNVTAIRGSDYTPITDITVGVEPCKLAADSQRERVYVTHHKEPDRGAAAIDGSDDTFYKYYERVRAQAPYGIDVDRAGNMLFVATRDAGLIAIHDADEYLNDWLWIKLDPIRVPFVVAWNPTTQHLLVAADDPEAGNNVVVVLAPYSIELDKGRWTTIEGLPVFVLDRKNAAWIAEVEVGIGAEDGIAVNRETSLVYVTNTGSDTVSVVQDSPQPGDIVLVTSIPVGDQPMGIDVDVARNLIYAGNAGSRTLSVISGVSHTVVKTIPLD